VSKVPSTALKYKSGEAIQKADHVLFHGEPATIEFVAVELGDPHTNWYVQEFGGGVSILEPKYFGRAFIPADQISEAALQFVSRAAAR
jgi:hypothetical protein